MLTRLRQLCCHRALIPPDLLDELRLGHIPRGMKYSESQKLEEILRQILQDGFECCVCLGVVIDQQSVCITRCKHAFCEVILIGLTVGMHLPSDQSNLY